MYSFQFGNQTIPYTLSTSHRRKTLSISVDQHGVSVISPSDIDLEKIESTLHKKAIWIIKQLSDFNEMQINVTGTFLFIWRKTTLSRSALSLKNNKNRLRQTKLSLLSKSLFSRTST